MRSFWRQVILTKMHAISTDCYAKIRAVVDDQFRAIAGEPAQLAGAGQEALPLARFVAKLNQLRSTFE